MKSHLSRFVALASVLVVPLVVTGCRTGFSGDSHARGCVTACQEQGLVMGAYVIMGEYSDGCVCQSSASLSPPAEGSSAGAAPDAVQDGAIAGAGAAAAAVRQTQKGDVEFKLFK